MKAALFTGARAIEIVDIPIPEINDGEVLVKMKACGICGGDIPFYNGIPDYTCRHPWIIGHEMAGIVSNIKDKTNNLRIGDRIAIEPIISCGTCYACRVGKYNCCANIRIIGSHCSGGFAEYVRVPADRCHKIPDTMSFSVAAICEPFSIGANVCVRGNISSSDQVVINGAGAVGYAVADFAKNVYSAQVMCVDVIDQRLNKVKEIGVDITVNAMRECVNDKIMSWTGGEGASVAVAATGVSSVIEGLIDQVASGGRIVIVGITEDNVRFNGVSIIKKELSILGSRNSSGIYKKVIDNVQKGKLHPEKFISHKYSFQDIAKCFEYASNNIAEILKVVIEFE